MNDDEDLDDQLPTMVGGDMPGLSTSTQQQGRYQYESEEEENSLIILNGRTIVVEDEQFIKPAHEMGGAPVMEASDTDDDQVPALEQGAIIMRRSRSPSLEESNCRSMSSSPTLSEDETREYWNMW